VALLPCREPVGVEGGRALILLCMWLLAVKDRSTSLSARPHMTLRYSDSTFIAAPSNKSLYESPHKVKANAASLSRRTGGETPTGPPRSCGCTCGGLLRGHATRLPMSPSFGAPAKKRVMCGCLSSLSEFNDFRRLGPYIGVVLASLPCVSASLSLAKPATRSRFRLRFVRFVQSSET